MKRAFDFFAALALLVAEFFIPSGGMILIVALSATAASIWCAWNAWWYDPTKPRITPSTTSSTG